MTRYRDLQDSAPVIHASLAFGMNRENDYTPDVGFRAVDLRDDGRLALQLAWKARDGVLETRTLTHEETFAVVRFVNDHF